ncbi:MAG TPA: prepilin-type N-terminal cleavage/methylation domain-containing protein [Gemmataceae bacterium]|nr:prepilin-type N-terminal cleavage/methylation domain-containing protein [Gemmataceae bacterium]
MRRRQGFTLVELLVSMALIMFIMAILSQAFVAATSTFRNLKAAGDMAEKLRATTQILQRDLAADHFEGKKRLSNPNFWVNGPPEQGFFQILQGGADTPESPAGDPSGINSFRSTNHALAFAIKLRGNQMSDFLSASTTGGGAILSGITSFGPPEARYQATSGGSYNYQWAEVAWFMVAQPDTTIADPTTGAPAQQLFTLFRRQHLLVPDNSLVPAQPAGNIAQFQEISCWANGANLYFNSPLDITDPQRRFGGGTGAFTPIPQGQGVLSGSDIQLTDVVSFDVRLLPMLPAGTPMPLDPFVTLSQAPFTGFQNGNPGFGGVMVFDTWTSINDGLGNSYAQWNTPGTTNPVPATSIPLWSSNPITYNTPYPSGANSITVTGSGPIIQAIQISIRIWDAKTNQTRQVTIVQAM